MISSLKKINSLFDCLLKFLSFILNENTQKLVKQISPLTDKSFEISKIKNVVTQIKEVNTKLESFYEEINKFEESALILISEIDAKYAVWFEKLKALEEAIANAKGKSNDQELVKASHEFYSAEFQVFIKGRALMKLNEAFVLSNNKNLINQDYVGIQVYFSFDQCSELLSSFFEIFGLETYAALKTYQQLQLTTFHELKELLDKLNNIQVAISKESSKLKRITKNAEVSKNTKNEKEATEQKEQLEEALKTFILLEEKFRLEVGSKTAELQKIKAKRNDNFESLVREAQNLEQTLKQKDPILVKNVSNALSEITDLLDSSTIDHEVSNSSTELYEAIRQEVIDSASAKINSTEKNYNQELKKNIWIPDLETDDYVETILRYKLINEEIEQIDKEIELLKSEVADLEKPNKVPINRLRFWVTTICLIVLLTCLGVHRVYQIRKENELDDNESDSQDELVANIS